MAAQPFDLPGSISGILVGGMSSTVSRAVLVTGSSSGIGRATALRLAQSGWDVYASARRPESISDLADHGCRLLQLDVTDEGSMVAAVRKVEAERGAVGVLVNNAGYGQGGAVEEVPLDAMRRQFETNFFGLARLTQLVLPGMRRQRWGKVVNVSSMGGRLTLPGGGVYHATKHAVEALSDALRFEVKGFGVDVIVIEPGVVKTRFGDVNVETIDLGDPEGPYARFNAGVARVVAGAYSPRARGMGTSEGVAAVVERAISARRPKTRYVYPAMGRALITARRLLPDRAFDLLLRTRYPAPKP
ncbi:MAG TPA: oxidoreductase [Actinomycetota bacterium]|nr:oxidoreductase [Actinomycetota bacterium]